jgi:hypothetical protein
LFVSPCAVHESARRHVERRQRLKQKLQCDGGIDIGPVDQTGVILDDLQHADLFLQRAATEVMTDGQTVFVLRGQVCPQRGCVLNMEIRGVRHDETPR